MKHKITIMGDLNQRIDKHSNVKNREEYIRSFDDIKVEVLSKSYRSTANITNFSKEILHTHEPIEAVDSTGEKPRIHVSAEHVIDEIVKTVNEMKDKEFKSIAIICKTKDYGRQDL